MPSVSRQQQKAMHAAASGHSTIGIPQSVGEEYAAADHARGPHKLPAHAPGDGKAEKHLEATDPPKVDGGSSICTHCGGSGKMNQAVNAHGGTQTQHLQANAQHAPSPKMAPAHKPSGHPIEDWQWDGQQ